MTETSRIEDAAESALPRLLVEPPWTRRGRAGTEPVVLKGLKRPTTPAAESWPPGLREEWLESRDGFAKAYQPALPDDSDWEAVAEHYRSGAALRDPRGGDRARRFYWLVVRGPGDLADELLADERYHEDWAGWSYRTPLKHFAARRGTAARALILHATKKHASCADALVPFVDDATARAMINGIGRHDDAAVRLWFGWHGAAAAPFVIPDALRKPGPKRTKAEQALALIAREHGSACIVEAARQYGDEAAAAIDALGTDPLDQYPDDLPQWDEEIVRDKLPQLLLRGRERALPVGAARHFVTMLLISTPEDPYQGCEQVIELCDPGSLAEFAWAVYENDRGSGLWASTGAQYALRRLGDAETAARLAGRMARWDNYYSWTFKGLTALDVLMAIDAPPDDLLRHLDRLARRAADAKHIRPRAQRRLDAIARERALTPEQLADRIVPDLGLDAAGSMTLDYGPRRFVVGFDEQLKPFVADEDGKPRKTLPKPGVKDDDALAPAAYKRFADLKKEAKAVAADQLKRLEKAMVAGRSWTSGEFGSIFAGHPLLGHLVRRLVWSADGTAFRVAEDGTLADVRDDAFVLPPDARVMLPHPVLLGQDTVAAWASVFADYEILQPFPQLGRPVHELADDERDTGRLKRFEGRTAHFGRFMGMTSRGWELGDKETGGFRRQVNLMTPDDRHVMVAFEPGIRVIDPEEYAEQTIERVMLMTGRYSGTEHPFGALDPVTASEMIAELERVTG
ncbi:DUF4132 domain-containing protein [Actinomadura darangshiensis]|uniref:DUF4132 domain-containing protein n=1 Tax=Actinomadura darangshiensis TaxID=705336 RepID=A0A4R5BCS4_9ACTN|nr:DUF4132 domain-containing protein [Actinomadura darangshiensis]TDD82516.1 DUF4132 domain-containing protein [Actinomadura darangshiensis]